MAKNLGLVRAFLVSGLALGFAYGCGESMLSSVDSPLVSEQPPTETATMPETVTLYFDGNSQVFSIADLAISLALFLNPEASVSEIQQVAQDVFDLDLVPAQITGSGSTPIQLFDLNNDGNRGDLLDLGVAIAVFLGQETAEAINATCQDMLSQSCNMSANSSIPTFDTGIGPGSPGTGILPEITPIPQPPTGGQRPVGVETVVLNPTVVEFPEGSTISDVELFTISPTAAPIGGSLVLRLTSSNPQVVSLDDIGSAERIITIPEGSSAARTVSLFRRIRSSLVGNAIVTVTIDATSEAANFPVNSVDETLLVRLRAGEEVATVEPDSTFGFSVEQITLQAEEFNLVQAPGTGIIGFGPINGSGAPSTAFGPASVVQKFPSPPFDPVCQNAFIGVRPFFVINEANGNGVFVLDDTVNPSSRIKTPITLSGQALNFRRRNRDGVLFAQISPANFDEIYRVNYFSPEEFVVREADCLDTIENFIRIFSLDFDSVTQTVGGVLRSSDRLFTLRGTAQGINEPDSSTNLGQLFGSQISSDRPSPNDIRALENPRFSGVQNVLDVSSNQIRTDISFVFDQIGGQATFCCDSRSALSA
ncbi:MAG: hypothetical protein HC924_18110, partial [Synechococcaceae cyanobacterium SM2_3_2]|nr:hypothetical protein [Synechococcaceae cyanobacterium SM2_3_2]